MDFITIKYVIHLCVINFDTWPYITLRCNIIIIMGLNMRKSDFVACVQQRHGPACTSAQSDQHLCYSLSENYCGSIATRKISISI